MRQNSTQAEFMLSIYSVKLAIKFPCRMSLHQDGKPITTEVQPANNVFTFNQDISVKVNLKNDVEISAYLSTGKGGSILAGLISISIDALAAKQGTRFTLPLQKCIDTAATAELKLNHAWVPQQVQVPNMSRSTVGGMMRSNSPPVNRGKVRTQNDLVETRSQYQAQTPRRTPTVMVGGNLLMKDKQKDFEQRRVVNSKQLVNNKISFRYDLPDSYQEDIRETKTIGGTGVRNRREKDKQRMQKLAARKIADETENNLKLDIMKYKMKGQQLQKSVTEKTKVIKQLKDQILGFERKKIQQTYIQQQLSSKETTIKILEDRISNITNQNTTLRQTIAENLRSISELKENIRFDILKNKEQYQKKQEILRTELNQSKGRIVELQADLVNKNLQLNKAKKYIQDLETGAEQKIFQHDRIIQDLKKQHSISQKQLSKRLAQYQNRIENLNKELQTKNNSISKLRDDIIKLQQIQRSFQEKTQTLEIQKTQLQAFKADFQVLTKKFNKIQQNLRDEQKNSKKLLQNKNKQLTDLQQMNAKNVKNLQSKIVTANEKGKQQKGKIQQLETLLSNSKSQEQKLKKTIQKLQKTIQQYQFKHQSLQKQLRNHENRYQILQKQLGQKSSSTTHIESLYKIQLEHSKETVVTLTRDLDDISAKYNKMKENMQFLRNQKVKLDNKVVLLQENLSRLTQYNKEKKAEFQAKQNQLKQNIKNLNNTIRNLQQSQRNKQKQINAWQIKQLTTNNKFEKAQKSLQEHQALVEKLQNVTIPKLQQQKYILNQQLENTKHRLHESLQQNKMITNQRLKLQSETTKNTKITTVLNEEKASIVGQLSKNKATIQKMEKNEEKLTGQIKTLTEQNKKLILKIEATEKQLNKMKDMMNDTANLVVAVSKKGMKDSGTALDFSSKSRKTTFGQTEGLKKKETIIQNLASSRVMSSSSQMDIKRITQIVQTTSKQQQNTIVMQQETISQCRVTIQNLENQLASLSQSSQQHQASLEHTIDSLSAEIEQNHQKLLSITNDYEDKISKLETEINKKDKDIKSNKSIIGSLKYEIETLKKKIEIFSQETQFKELKSGEKMGELVGQCNFLQSSLKGLQAEKRNLEIKIYGLEEDIVRQKDQRIRKQKQLQQVTQKWSILRMQFEDLAKIKKQNLQQLLSLKQQSHALKENLEKVQQSLKAEQKNNKKLQDFINQLIKQKQNIVKVQLESSSKAIQMESTVLQMKNLLENKDEQLKQKQQANAQLKSNIKILQGELKGLEAEVKQCNNKINILNNKIEERDRKYHEKQSELKESKTQYNNLAVKNRQQLKIIRQQYEQLQKRSQSAEQLKDTKIFSLQKQILQLQSQIQSMSNQLIHKQQLIFFQKQRASLSQSSINDMKKGQSQINLMISKYQRQINQLNEELTFKEETLYDYSGKIYQLQQKLEAKEAEIAIREEKVDIDWQCRHDQICQEYEQKIETLQKDKKYLKQKVDSLQQQKLKIASQKQKYSEQFQKDLGVSKAKQKQMEQEKLQQINVKNKEIETFKQEISLLNNQIKNYLIEIKKKQNQITNKDEVIKKLEIRIHQNDRGSGSLKKQYEQEINTLKKNQNAIKMLKDQIKNAQWSTQREVKKITQNFIQKVVNCFPQAKEKLVEPIRTLESSMSTVINFKV